MRKRFKDADWRLPNESSWDVTKAALLMDLRDELKLIRRHTRSSAKVLSCRNAAAIPGILRKIEAHLRSPSVEQRRRLARRRALRRGR